MEERVLTESLVPKAVLAERLGVSESCIEKWAGEKRIPYYRFGRRCIRYDVCEVLRALKKFHAPATRRFIRKPYTPRRRRKVIAPARAVQLELNLHSDMDTLPLLLDAWIYRR